MNCGVLPYKPMALQSHIPGLGAVTKDDEFGWYYSQPLVIPVLGDQPCRMVVEGYDEDANKDEFHAAIRNFLALDPCVLRQCEEHVYRYYQDRNGDLEPGEEGYTVIESPSDVWAHVCLGCEPMVVRRASGDKRIYVSVECNCDWEIEHGLQIVFKNGLRVNKIGPYDGHLTLSDAYNNESLENVIYE